MRLMALWVLGGIACTSSPEPAAAGPTRTPIRIGWQTTWATQGQLAVTLMHTDILAQHGFTAQFEGFSYGGPLNEGALAGAVDVLFTADQPAIALASKAPSWGIVGRLMSNRVGTFVPPGATTQTAADLRGRTIAVPFGAAAHRATLGALRGAGLDPATDVVVQNLGIQEIVALVGAGVDPRTQRWGEVDAAGAWDPALANLEEAGVARVIDMQTVTSVVVMNDTFVSSFPGADARFMEALFSAYDYVRTHPDEANRWFLEDSELPFSAAVLERAAAVEPNLAAASAPDMRVHLVEAEIAGMQEAADFMVEAGLLRAATPVAPMVRPVAKVPHPSAVLAPAVHVASAGI